MPVTFSLIHKALDELETDTLLIVVDGRLWQHYKKELSFDSSGKKTLLYTTPSGEATKTVLEYEKCAEFFLAKGVHRKSHLVAIGGGATSDMAGFVASTLLRGVAWTVVPSTLLAMVDAAIGGKVAINSKSGKNLLGAFHMPKSVLINTAFLQSLPEDEITSGMGEVFKYAFLSSDIYQMLMEPIVQPGKATLLNHAVITKCAEYKQEIVEVDFKESNRRKILNLGHTFGHAYELLYNISHGESVVWGMLTVFLLDERTDLVEELSHLLSKYNWKKMAPPWHNKTISVEKIFDYVIKDKKVVSNQEIEMVKIEKVGKPVITKTSLENLTSQFESKVDLLRTFKFHG